ncbi:MAG: C69 family dipeptidase [Eggerthellaceae bacterium]|nr:C69 family dipeptidase [Eggerthellaceae bacterium]
MPCTTILVGSKASNDGSTMIARTDDGRFDTKKWIVVEPKDQPRTYTSVLSHVTVELPDNPMRYTSCPNVEAGRGTWAATGINAANVGMTATETITSNPRVLAADPLIEYTPAKGRKKAVPGGIGEEDIVVLVLPYIHTAREGVLRLASLLEQYGTYESNGIAFNDEHEVWWMETIGGHHWMARRVPDEVVVIMPNQFGMDAFDFDDAFGAQKAHLCSADLREFIRDNNLDTNQAGRVNPRDIFGSHTDMDHIYNTPRAWFIGRYLTPFSHTWEGEGAEFTLESDNIPWSLVPDRKVAVEDMKYMLSGHYQGTPFDPYAGHDTGMRGRYRSIGINRTDVTSICQIRPYAPEAVKGLEWVCFGPTSFNSLLPLYPCVAKMPKYVSRVSDQASTEDFYWSSVLIGALADAHFPDTIQLVGRYQEAMMVRSRKLVSEYDAKIAETGDASLAAEANEKLCAMAKEETTKALTNVAKAARSLMKNGFKLADH